MSANPFKVVRLHPAPKKAVTQDDLKNLARLFGEQLSEVNANLDTLCRAINSNENILRENVNEALRKVHSDVVALQSAVEPDFAEPERSSEPDEGKFSWALRNQATIRQKLIDKYLRKGGK